MQSELDALVVVVVVVVVVDIVMYTCFEIMKAIKLCQVEILGWVPKNLSITALSKQFPLRLMLCVTP